METLLLVIVGLVATVPAAMLMGMFFLKGANAHNERMLREQEQLDKKNGTTPKPESTENTGAKKKRGTERVMAHLPSILVAAVGMMLIYWGFQNTQIGTADAGSWARNHWVPLLTFWAVGATLIAINAEMLKKAAGTLQWVLAGMMFMFFIGFPTIGWFGGSNSPEQKRTAAVTQQQQPERAAYSTPPASTAVPLVTEPKSGWSRLSVEAGGRGYIQLPSGMHHVVVTGDKYRLHTVYADGHECDTFGRETCPDGAVVEYYVSNEATEKNTILYSFVPI